MAILLILFFTLLASTPTPVHANLTLASLFSSELSTENAGVGRQNFDTCCARAIAESLMVENGSVRFAENQTVLHGSVEAFLRDPFPCTAEYNGTRGGEPQVTITYAWCKRTCPSWGLTTVKKLSDWILPLFAGIWPALAFWFLVPRRYTSRNFVDHISLFDNFGLLAYPMVLIIVLLYTICAAWFCMAMVAPILYQSFYAYYLDRRTIERLGTRNPLSKRERIRLLFSLLVGFVDLEEFQDAFDMFMDTTLRHLNQPAPSSKKPTPTPTTTSTAIEARRARPPQLPLPIMTPLEVPLYQASSSGGTALRTLSPQSGSPNPVPPSQKKHPEALPTLRNPLVPAATSAQATSAILVTQPVPPSATEPQLAATAPIIQSTQPSGANFQSTSVADNPSTHLFHLIQSQENPTSSIVLGTGFFAMSIAGYIAFNSLYCFMDDYVSRVTDVTFGRCWQRSGAPDNAPQRSKWRRGSTKAEWIAYALRQSRPSIRKHFTEASFSERFWSMFCPTLILILLPTILACSISWTTPIVGLSCRSLVFLTFGCWQTVSALVCLFDPDYISLLTLKRLTLTWSSISRREFTRVFAQALVLVPVGFIAWGGTVAHLIGLFQFCLCYTLAIEWGHLDSPDVKFYLGTNSSEQVKYAQQNWIGLGTAAIFVLLASATLRWIADIRLQKKLQDVVRRCEQ
ncbi:hypothetical protein CC80DRAFT_510380 [Byssothecium circinans]|uniref:Uncharacterized protein n=1 Tax=Byssothecium circinans TaxID=147558 RepID=A0A6A5TAG1_9PLEO|nr:hypothetical protein CC80DRAFT_510380 [Byssothecium circinans]